MIKMIFFSPSLHSRRSLCVGKKPTFVPVHKKKNDKQSIKNYIPVPLLSICRKVLEIFFFIENDLISKNQSGFRPGESCSNQLS